MIGLPTEKVGAEVTNRFLATIPILDFPWVNFFMDFIMGFPKIDGFWSIMVVVDRFFKYGTFIPAIKECPAKEVVRLFFKHVVKY